MLSKKQLNDVCLINGGSQHCCYRVDSKGVHFCVKKSPVLKKKVDERVRKYLEDCAKNGTDPYASNFQLGNNCPGYPLLRNIEQGYDIP